MQTEATRERCVAHGERWRTGYAQAPGDVAPDSASTDAGTSSSRHQLTVPAAYHLFRANHLLATYSKACPAFGPTPASHQPLTIRLYCRPRSTTPSALRMVASTRSPGFRYCGRSACTFMNTCHFFASGNKAPSFCINGDGIESAQPAGVPVERRSPAYMSCTPESSVSVSAGLNTRFAVLSCWRTSPFTFSVSCSAFRDRKSVVEGRATA